MDEAEVGGVVDSQRLLPLEAGAEHRAEEVRGGEVE